jgi:hypothetical protein
VGNFSNQMLGLYHNEGSGLFVDEAPQSTVGRASLLSLAFGVFFFDYDLDGFLDIFAANGHIDEEIGRVQPKISFQQPALLFRNNGKGRFTTVGNEAGSALFRPIVGRGAAYGDFDRDGDLDVLVTTNHGPAYLFRNDGGNENNWIQFRLAGTKSSKSAVGAVVRVQSASGYQWRTVHTGSSYCSQSDLTLTFGLGKDPAVQAVEVLWPTGAKQKFTDLPVRQRYLITEGGAPQKLQ